MESLNRSTSTSRPVRSGTPEGAGNVTTSQGYNVGPQGRRVIMPDEWLVLPESVGMVFHKALPPIALELVRYHDAPELSGGGTGQGRRLGLPSLAASLLVLLASLGGTGLLLAVPGLLQQAAFDPRPGVATPGYPVSRRLPAGAARQPAGPRPQPRLAGPENQRLNALMKQRHATPEPATPEVEWDFEGRVWHRRPDGGRVQISGPPLPGRSGR